MDKKHFLFDVRALLKYHQASGIDRYPKGVESDAFFRFQPPSLVSKRSAVQKEKPHQTPIIGADLVSSVEKTPLNLADIAEEVAVCRACDLHKQRLYPVPGRGSDKVRLLIVGDWLASDGQGLLPPGRIFGVEQEEMLAKMLIAIQMPISAVFITNVIKCAVPATCQPQAGHVLSCISFLRRQISVLMPEMICVMGMVAARAILGKSLPLSRLRGRLHGYEVSRNVTIPVVATYHPTYLLQNPEMKMATWADLQLLARELQ